MVKMQTNTSQNIVYYDSGVWVSYMLGSTDHFYTVCKPLIDDVEHGRCVGVVSYLNIMETGSGKSTVSGSFHHSKNTWCFSLQ